MQHIRPVDYQCFINKMVEKSVLHFFSSLNEYKISAFFGIMKASEKLCAKSFLRGWFEVYFGMYEIYCIAFVGDDVCGYFAGCFSKVEDDVVYYNGANQKKIVCLPNVFLSPSFWLYFNGCIYEYGDKVKLMI